MLNQVCISREQDSVSCVSQVSVGVVQHLTWHLASHKNNMVVFNSAYKVWSVAPV